MASEDYRIYFYKKSSNGRTPVKEYLLSLSKKERAKVDAYVQLLKENKGHLSEPYSRHLQEGIRELRPRRNRVLYALVRGKKIILLHAFKKKTQKTPKQEIEKATNNLNDFKSNPEITLEKF